MSYVEAQDVAAAVAALSSGARPVAGGTDLVVGARQGKSPLPAQLVGIHRIAGLDTVTIDNDTEGHTRDGAHGGRVRIGALVTHAQILADPVLAQRLPALLDASAIVGSHATRAQGTLGGNVMNASPAMDTGAPLLCAGAEAVLVGPSGERTVALDELWTGPGRTSAAADELLVAIELPALGAAAQSSAYVRLQYRRQMEIAVVGAAVRLELTADGARVAAAWVAITALAPVIHRVPAAEELLVGAPSGGDGLATAARAAGEQAAAASRPISDVRGSAAYRRAMAAVVTRRAVRAAAARATGEPVAVPASDTTIRN